MIANTGAGLVAVALVLDAWFVPPLPIFFTLPSSVVALVTMLVAKQVRESEGTEIPAVVQQTGSPIANIEVGFSLVDGLFVAAILSIENFGVSKIYQQIVTIGALAMFATTIVVFRFTRRRFDALMRAAGVDSSTS